MTLKEYLLANRIGTRTFAAAIGYPFETVRKWRQGSRLPRPESILKIAQHTKGKVKAYDWYPKE